MNKNIKSRRINVLRDSVARRIAAGEVIDRPQAVVRELLDNSIDAESTDISLYVEKGGTSEIRVVDNGTGMDAENLERCFLPHSTSKIVDFEDIYSTSTLGFRGEALSSIASCSKLRIISAVSDSEPANKLEVYDGKLRELGEFRGSKGTLISVKDLFYSMPGRKNFLKSAGAEASQCRIMFIEKALPQTDINFRYFNDGKLRLFLPASDLVSRVHNAYGSLFQKEFLRSFSTTDGEIGISAVAGSPSLYRKDRKYIHVFINNRRINDFSLIQAIDYAYSSYLPGGCHPVCFLFLKIPPQHIDFNIHPAKREVKFRNLPEIHHTVSSAVASHLAGRNNFNAKPSEHRRQPVLGLAAGEKPESGFSMGRYNNRYGIPDRSIFRKESLSGIKAELQTETALIRPAASDPATEAPAAIPGNEPSVPAPAAEYPARLVYLGQLFNLFLLFETDDNLLLIDQHAAHERIIFNRLCERRPELQQLLVPLRFTLESDEQDALERCLDEYRALGFDLEKDCDREWHINSLPSVCDGMEDELTSFFRDSITDPDELKRKLYAMISCKSAIKDGDRVDEMTALELAGKVLELDNPRCPHGRPVLQLISRDELYKMFGRTF